MRIALKYGLLITLGGIAWVVITHLLVPDPGSPVHRFGAGIFLNILQIAGTFLAIEALKKESGGQLVFKTGVQTGVATAFIYGFSFCLFFVVALLAVGSRLMASEPGMENLPVWQKALFAFVSLFVGSLVFGLIYSSLISFFLAKRRDDS